jgi:hypothetical protein
MSAVKEEAKKLIDSLPELATWDDLMYELYVKHKLRKALDEAAAGKVVSHEAVKRELTSE